MELMTRTTAHSPSQWTRRLFTSKVGHPPGPSHSLPIPPPILHSHSQSCMAENQRPSVRLSVRCLCLSTLCLHPRRSFTPSPALPFPSLPFDGRGLVCSEREDTHAAVHASVEGRGEHPPPSTSAELLASWSRLVLFCPNWANLFHN